MTKDSFDNLIFLDKEEQELSESVERGEWKSVSAEQKEEDLADFRTAMKNTFGKTRPISLRVNEVDLMKLKARALEQGLSYQTLMNSVIHQYVNTRHITDNQQRTKEYN